MKMVALQFPDLRLLWNFAKTLPSHNLEINEKQRILYCHCTEKNIADAIRIYRATLVETPGNLTSILPIVLAATIIPSKIWLYTALIA